MLIFCDVIKAFDCMQHCTLVEKLNYYDIRVYVFNALTSYLPNRVYRVNVNGKKFPGLLIGMGVPQGSIIGLFLLSLPYLVRRAHEVVLLAVGTLFIFKIRRFNAHNLL